MSGAATGPEAPQSFPLTEENYRRKGWKFNPTWVEWYDLCFVIPLNDEKDGSQVLSPEAAMQLLNKICIPQPCIEDPKIETENDIESATPEADTIGSEPTTVHTRRRRRYRLGEGASPSHLHPPSQDGEGPVSVPRPVGQQHGDRHRPQYSTDPRHGAEPPQSGPPTIYLFDKPMKSLDGLTFTAPVAKKELRAILRHTLMQFLQSTDCYLSEETHGSHRFLKVRLSDGAGKDVALRTDYVLQMDRSAVRNDYIKKHKLFIPPFADFDDDAENRTGQGYACMQWTNHVWARYDAAGKPVDEKSLDPNAKEVSVFRPLDRVRLFLSVMSRHWWLQGMIDAGVIADYFVLPQASDIFRLRRDWADFRLILHDTQPTAHLKNYYGEGLALYFMWLGFFTHKLKWLSIVGLIAFCIQIGFDPKANFWSGASNIASIVFSLCVVLWSAHFLDSWRRVEELVLVRWGVSGGAVRVPVVRPNFKADKYVADEVHRQLLQKEALWWKQYSRRMISLCVTLLVMGADIGCVGAIYSLTYFARREPDRFEWAKGQVSWIISIGTVIIIYVFDTIWGYLAPALTNLENWKYDYGHEASFITKVFVFRMMNNFANLIFVAFVKDYYDPCAPREQGGCLPQLRLNLATQFITRVAFNIVEVGWPFAVSLLHRYFLNRQNAQQVFAQAAVVADEIIQKQETETKDAKAPEKTGRFAFLKHPVLNSLEIEFTKPSYDPLTDLVNDYMETMISFAYVVVFSIVLPVIPLLTWLCNLVEIRSDAFKIVFCHRRIVPHTRPRGDGLGTWRQLLFGLSCGAIAVNVAMSFFVIGIGFGVDLSLAWRLILFVIGEHVVLLTPWLISFATLDATGQLNAQLRLLREGWKEAVWGDRGNAEALDDLQTPMVVPITIRRPKVGAFEELGGIQRGDEDAGAEGTQTRTKSIRAS